MTRLSLTPVVDAPATWPSVPCKTDPDLFFSATPANVHAAQRVCAVCPVLRRCARYTLAHPQRNTDGVFASVLLPRAGCGEAARDHAEAQLREVARTGKPAPAAEGLRGPAHQWDQAELRARVVELHALGLSWSVIGRELGCDYKTVQKAHAAAIASTEAVA